MGFPFGGISDFRALLIFRLEMSNVLYCSVWVFFALLFSKQEVQT